MVHEGFSTFYYSRKLCLIVEIPCHSAHAILILFVLLADTWRTDHVPFVRVFLCPWVTNRIGVQKQALRTEISQQVPPETQTSPSPPCVACGCPVCMSFYPMCVSLRMGVWCVCPCVPCACPCVLCVSQHPTCVSLRPTWASGVGVPAPSHPWVPCGCPCVPCACPCTCASRVGLSDGRAHLRKGGCRRWGEV